MKKHGVFSLLLLSLTACSGKAARPNESYFSNADDPDLSYITRNGENRGKEGVGYSYQEVSREATVESISRDIDAGKSVYLFLHLDTCSHCAAAHDDYVNAWLDSGIEVYSLEFIQKDIASGMAVLHGLVERYPAYGKYLNEGIVTPSTFLLDNAEKIRAVGMENQRESLQNLEEFLKNLLNFTYIYTFRTFDSYLKFAQENDCLVYRNGIDDEFYPTQVYPLAKRSSRHTAELQTEYFSEEDLKRLDEYIGSDNQLGLIEKGALTQKTSVYESPDVAGQIIQSFYQK